MHIYRQHATFRLVANPWAIPYLGLRGEQGLHWPAEELADPLELVALRLLLAPTHGSTGQVTTDPRLEGREGDALEVDGHSDEPTRAFFLELEDIEVVEIRLLDLHPIFYCKSNACLMLAIEHLVDHEVFGPEAEKGSASSRQTRKDEVLVWQVQRGCGVDIGGVPLNISTTCIMLSPATARATAQQ